MVVCDFSLTEILPIILLTKRQSSIVSPFGHMNKFPELILCLKREISLISALPSVVSAPQPFGSLLAAGGERLIVFLKTNQIQFNTLKVDHKNKGLSRILCLAWKEGWKEKEIILLTKVREEDRFILIKQVGIELFPNFFPKQLQLPWNLFLLFSKESRNFPLFCNLKHVLSFFFYFKRKHKPNSFFLRNS